MRHFRFLLVGCFFMLATIAFAQPKGKPKSPDSKSNSTSNKTKTMFEGTIKQKPWSKSAQSYCAQGSEYFVLVKSDNEEVVIQNETGEDLTAFEGKKVTIEGKIETKTIKPSSNPMEQRPVSSSPFGEQPKEESFTCTVLVAKKIK
jgi:hypothetical protein